jgi:surface polysaccharide O-acyltransferase-like enzyme
LAIYLAGAISLIFTIIITIVLSKKAHATVEYWYGFLLPNTMFVAYSVFIMLKQIFATVKLSQSAARVLADVSGCTFGIYLVHDFINQIYRVLGLAATSKNPVFMVPLMSIVNFSVCLFGVYILRKVSWFKRYLS